MADEKSTYDEADITEVMDASGLACPLPLLKAKQTLAKVESGALIKVLATDPGSVRDFHSFIDLTDHELVSFEQLNSAYIYVIKKA